MAEHHERQIRRSGKLERYKLNMEINELLKQGISPESVAAIGYDVDLVQQIQTYRKRKEAWDRGERLPKDEKPLDLPRNRAIQDMKDNWPKRGGPQPN